MITKTASVVLIDRSTYHGQVNDDGLPDGMGVLVSSFGMTYSGAMKDGNKSGAGVERQTNGTSYYGEFQDGVANGYGIYVGVFGNKYIGQWKDGARHGVGLSVDAEAVMTVGNFNMDEPIQTSCASTGTMCWETDVQPHVLRAVLAKKIAICNQEIARQRHIDAIIDGMISIGSKQFNTLESIEAFEAEDELETAAFIHDQCDQMQSVNIVAKELKFSEAQLTQYQKELRIEITVKQQELSYIAKYCALAKTRKAQVQEAESTLATLLDSRIIANPRGKQ